MEIVADIAKVLLQPSNLIGILCFLALMGAWRGWRCRGLALLSALLLLATATLPLGGWLYLPLENRIAAPTSLPERADGIVVLGGAVNMRVTERRSQATLNEHAERMTETVALARRYPSARIVFTGGNRRGVTESDVARLFFASQGIEGARLAFEDRSHSTYDNAVFTQRLAAPKAGETWLLVTSAYHMPRALGAFRKAGWEIAPYPVDYRTPGYIRPVPDLDLGENLDDFDNAFREWLSLAVYFALGRTDTLFPK